MEFTPSDREFQLRRHESPDMAMEMQHYCRECGGERTYWRVASTQIHLGEKVKWRCEECDHGFVRIDGEVDTSEAA